MYSNIGFDDPVYHDEWGEEKLMALNNMVIRVKAIPQPSATCYIDGISGIKVVNASPLIR